MLPLIVGYIGGYSEAKPSKTFVQMLFFILGTAIVFSVIGIFCALTGKVFVAFAGAVKGCDLRATASYFLTIGAGVHVDGAA